MQRHRIPDELTPDEEVVVGDPIVDLDGDEAREEFVDAREWDRVERYSVAWGTYEFQAATAISPDGDTYTRVEPHTTPREAPPSAEVLLADLVDRGGRDALAAVALASGCGLAARPHRRHDRQRGPRPRFDTVDTDLSRPDAKPT